MRRFNEKAVSERLYAVYGVRRAALFKSLRSNRQSKPVNGPLPPSAKDRRRHALALRGSQDIYQQYCRDQNVDVYISVPYDRNLW
jgi:hypothetical protein